MLLIQLNNIARFLLPVICLLFSKNLLSQNNLLLNGNFEDINTCTEYKSECGVEAWFYLNNVKVQMLTNEDPQLYQYLGSNSFGLFFNWVGYKKFSPVIGTILPCRLQKDTRYIFRGMFKKANINSKLILWPGVAVDENFYVPNRPFSAAMHPDSITQIKYFPKTEFYQFEYSFVANGKEKYLTFGTFITEDTSRSKVKLIGTQTISIVLDNFQLLPAETNETDCNHYTENKEAIYKYDFRHKEMDYSLYSRGDLNIDFDETDSNDIVKVIPIPAKEKPVKTDTLKLGDVFFDFNKAKLKPEALGMLEKFFKEGKAKNEIDSIYIDGHTDSIGSDSKNMQLSTQRCQSVESWLTKNDILEKEDIQIHPMGKSRPVASNSTPQGRAINRRVEMIIFRKEKNQ
jgi:outer membrane protein OmpA-like peptidoglycan-associated protein